MEYKRIKFGIKEARKLKEESYYCSEEESYYTLEKAINLLKDTWEDCHTIRNSIRIALKGACLLK